MLSELEEWETLLHETARAVELDPGDGLARAMSVVARARSGAEIDVVEALEAELSLVPDDPDLLFELGNAYAERDLLLEALPLLQEAQATTVIDEVHLLRLIEVMRALDRREAVASALRSMGPLDVLLPEVWLVLGRSCLESGNLACASMAMHRVSPLASGALEVWLRTRLGREHPTPRELGRLLLLAGDYRASAALLLAPTDEVPGTEDLFLAGRALVRAGEREKAVAVLGRSASEGPESPSLRCRSELIRGRSLLATGRSAEALPLFGAVYQRCGPTLESSLAYGEASMGSGQYADATRALAHLAELLIEVEGEFTRLSDEGVDRGRLRIDAATTLARMGGVYWGLGRFEDALQAYLLGGVLLGSDAGSSYNEGLCLEKMGLYAEAIAAFERALTLQPELPRAREHITALTQSLALGKSGKE